MKIIISSFLLGLLFLLSVSPINAGRVSGYFKRNGTYVQPYYRSSPNGFKFDNYSWNSSGSYYNNSYGKYNTYKWNTPSYSWQNDYYTGLNYYHYNNNWP